MLVKSNITGVADFEVPTKDLEWIRLALEAANRRLGWTEIQVALQALEMGFAGDKDGYRCHALAEAVFCPAWSGTASQGWIGWVITGGCSRGSKITVCRDGFSIQSWIGSWVSAKWRSYGAVQWDCDNWRASELWGDTPNGEAVSKEARIASLNATLQEMHQKEVVS